VKLLLLRLCLLAWALVTLPFWASIGALRGILCWLEELAESWVWLAHPAPRRAVTIAIQPIEDTMGQFKVVAYDDLNGEVALPAPAAVVGDNPDLADVTYDPDANVITVTRKAGQEGTENLTATCDGLPPATLAVELNAKAVRIAIVSAEV
jgi:hypothetical protein